MANFVFYDSWLDSLNDLGDNVEMAYKYLKAIVDYGITGDYDKSDGIINALMRSVVFSIDKSKGHY